MADEDTELSSLLDHTFVSITSTQKLEEGLKIFEKYEREALPIISEHGILVGIVTFDDIMDKISERDTEDIHKFGGSEGLDLSYTETDRKSTRLNSSHVAISYAVFCLKKKTQ